MPSQKGIVRKNRPMLTDTQEELLRYRLLIKIFDFFFIHNQLQMAKAVVSNTKAVQ